MADPYLLGNAGQFAVLGYGTGFTNLDNPGPTFVNGNIGTGAGGVENLGGAGNSITGHIFFQDPIVPGTNLLASGGPFSIAGGTCTAAGNGANCLTNTGADGQALIQRNSALVGGADTALLDMYNATRVLAPSQTVSTLNNFSSNTANGVANTTVVSVTGGTSLSAGKSITLTGDSSDFFIFNIGNGGLSGSAGGSIVLNGVAPDHVLFNFLCTGAGQSCNVGDSDPGDISFSGSFVGAGIILALDRNITEDQATWTGRFFSDTNQTIHLFSEAHITAPTPTPPTDTPEPTSILLFGTMLMGCSTLARRRFRHSRSD